MKKIILSVLTVLTLLVSCATSPSPPANSVTYRVSESQYIYFTKNGYVLVTGSEVYRGNYTVSRTDSVRARRMDNNAIGEVLLEGSPFRLYFINANTINGPAGTYRRETQERVSWWEQKISSIVAEQQTRQSTAQRESEARQRVTEDIPFGFAEENRR